MLEGSLVQVFGWNAGVVVRGGGGQCVGRGASEQVGADLAALEKFLSTKEWTNKDLYHDTKQKINP